jgi:GAF domain-containing protein
MSSGPAMGSGVDLQLVRAVLAPLLGDDGLDESLYACVGALAERLDAAFAGVWIVSPSGDTVDLRASAGSVRRPSDQHRRVPVGRFKIGTVVAERAPHFTNDVQHDPRGSDQDWARRERLVGFAGHPLLLGERVLGVLGIFARHPLDEGTIESLASVADLIALGVQRKRNEEQLRAQSRVVDVLYDIGTAIAAELDLARVVQLVTDSATELTGASFGAFFYNVTDDAGESYMLYTLAGVDAAHFASFPLPRNTPIFAPTFSGGPPVRSDDVTKHPDYGRNPPYHGMPPGHLPVRSYLAVPVCARDSGVLGGLFFGHTEPGRFTARHEQIVVGIAGHAAVAIEHARLYEQVHDIALTLQHGLLPERLPTPDGVGLAARYLPAARHADVGGDWYDAFMLPDGRLALTVGDVAGHDMVAAGVMGQLRSAVRAYALDLLEPAATLHRLDRFMSSLDLDTFATLLHATYSADTRQLDVVQAGHPPPMVIDPKGEPRFLPLIPQPPIGRSFFMEATPARVVLEPGETLVLYTDGLIERRGEIIDRGLARLEEEAAGTAHLSPDELCDRLLAQLGQEASDDIAVLAMRVGSS